MLVVMDWVAWHAAYDEPSSSLSARLKCVRAHLSQAVDRAPAGRVSLVSLCAGQGRDVIGVLPDHPRRDDVRAVLVESDDRNAGLARQAAAAQRRRQPTRPPCRARMARRPAVRLPRSVMDGGCVPRELGLPEGAMIGLSRGPARVTARHESHSAAPPDEVP